MVSNKVILCLRVPMTSIPRFPRVTLLKIFVYRLLNALPISSSAFSVRTRLVSFRFSFTAKIFCFKIFTSRLILDFKVTETPGITLLICIHMSFLPYIFFHNKIPYINLYFLHTQKQTTTDVYQWQLINRDVWLNLQIDGFGGLVVSILATGTRVRGFKPGRSRWIFRASGKSSVCLPSEGK